MSMQEKYFKKMRRDFGEFLSSDQVEYYVELFPELNSRLSKFAIGIFLWNMKGLIDIDNPDDVSKVRLILKVLDQTPGYDFFDNVFNEADPDTVCQIIGMSPVAPIEEREIEFDYRVSEIKNYKDAHSYYEMVSWCIVISEESFTEYTANGNRFYFCENGDWWDIPCIPGMGFPHDKYGYSLIAVEMTQENKIASVTSRWNTCAGDTGEFLSPEELRRVLGEVNFNKLFSKLSQHSTDDTN
ncbi:MAG: hypothetical protein K2M04_00480 [Muribaculaceae bacterium]|nr:hypothetical protein [Muribaculaceae bacterium]